MIIPARWGIWGIKGWCVRNFQRFLAPISLKKRLSAVLLVDNHVAIAQGGPEGRFLKVCVACLQTHANRKSHSQRLAAIPGANFPAFVWLGIRHLGY